MLRPQLWRKLKHVSELMDALLRIVQDLTMTLALIITASCTKQPPIWNIKLFQIDVADRQTDRQRVYKHIQIRCIQTDRQTTGIQSYTKSVECINLQYRQTDDGIYRRCQNTYQLHHQRRPPTPLPPRPRRGLVLVLVLADNDDVFISCTKCRISMYTHRQTERQTTVIIKIT